MFAPANNILQTKNTDFSIEMTLFAACVENVYNLRTEEKFVTYGVWLLLKLMLFSRQTRRDNTLLQNYVVETTGNNEMNKDEMRRFFYSTLDQVINEIDASFSHHNTKLYAAVSALQPENSNFLDVEIVQPFLDLLDRTSLEAEFDVAETYVAKFNGDVKAKPTTTKLISKHCEVLTVMPTIHLALKLGVTLGASTVKCENFFSVLKTIMRSRGRSMKQYRRDGVVVRASAS